ncbi:hypothetical protein BBJ28_00024215 [Nothophytophthora sp. Chile5]|nr:hypothetical protein BBJ28_00024215 [Nothophytophthora sp. Chile5]
MKAPGTLFGVPSNADPITYDLWDSRVSYGCRCDPWYHGADCSLRSCKVGVDPMYLSAGSPTYATFVVHAWIATGNYAPEVANAPIANYLLPAVTSKPGLSVVCQFQGNPGKLRAPEIAAYSFKGVVDPANKGAAVYTVEAGTDDEWFTKDSGLTVSSIVPDSTTHITTVTFTGSDVSIASIVPASTTVTMLFKLGPHVVLGTFVSTAASNGPTTVATTTLTLVFPLMHTVGKVVVFMPQGTFTLATVGATLTAVPVGQDYLLFAASSGLQPGNTIFFENQFYTVQEVFDNSAASPPVNPTIFTVRLDRPFSGNSLNGGATTLNLVYKVVLPTGLVDKTQLYNYVSPCSGRGLCGADTGVCTCFKGYTNDNCDTQNILAL